MKQWFPILQNKIKLAIDKIPTVVMSSFILHNIAKQWKHVGDDWGRIWIVLFVHTRSLKYQIQTWIEQLEQIPVLWYIIDPSYTIIR